MVVTALARGGGPLALGVVARLCSPCSAPGGSTCRARAARRERGPRAAGWGGRPPASGPRCGRARRCAGSERAGLRVTRGLGEPALFAITLSAVVASIYFALGVVAGDALGLTPLVYLLAGRLLRGHDAHLRRGQLAPPGARRRLDVRALRVRRALELHRRLGDPPRLPDRDGDRVRSSIPRLPGRVLGRRRTTAASSCVDRRARADRCVAVVERPRAARADRLGMRAARCRWSTSSLLLAVIVVGVRRSSSTLGAITDSRRARRARRSGTTSIFALGVAVRGAHRASRRRRASPARCGSARRGLRRVVIVVRRRSRCCCCRACRSSALMALPVVGGATPLGGRFMEAPVLGVVNAFEPDWLRDALPLRGRRHRGAVAARQAMNGQMLGLVAAGLLARHQPPDPERCRAGSARSAARPTWRSRSRACIAFGLALPARPRVPGGHLRVRGDARVRDRAPLGDRAALPRARPPARLPRCRSRCTVRRRLGAAAGGARARRWRSRRGSACRPPRGRARRRAASGWSPGSLLYVDLPARPGQAAAQALHDPGRGAAGARRRSSTAASSCRSSASELDDDIVGTAGRLAAEQADEGEGGAVIEALYVFEIPMSLPIDARVPDERVERGAGARCARAKEVGEEYEGVEVATAMVRGRTVGRRRSSRRPGGAGWRRSCSPPRSPRACAAGRSSAAAAGRATASSGRPRATWSRRRPAG